MRTPIPVSRLRILGLYLALVGLLSAVLVTSPAYAGHPEVTLGNSNFEIDTNANIRANDAGRIDWLNAGTNAMPDAVIVQKDQPSGQNDNSFGQGTKEDTQIPTVVAGSIPPNKSDLLEFGVYREDNGQDGILNLFWSRVQDPKGTTNMDFEFNKNKCDPNDLAGSVCSGNGVTPVRSKGDLLIVYELSKGGTVPELFAFTWLDGTEAPLIPCEASNSYPCWGDRTDLDEAGNAAGSINSSAIAQGTTVFGDVLGPYGPRTFGEAQIDLAAVFDPGKCESFGSAYLKSRSSDSFTAALKDFIAPEPVNLTNCGKVIIRKQTNPTPDPDATDFGFTKTFPTDPANGDTFSLKDGGSKTYDNVLFGTGYTVTESTVPAGWDLESIDCSASVGLGTDGDEIVVDVANEKITFDIDDAADVVDCTFTNRARAKLTVVKKTVDAAGAFDFTSTTLTPAAFTLTTTAAGDAGADSREFSNLDPGTYDVTESTPPAGWTLTSATCDNGDLPAAVTLGAGDDVTCTFVNTATADLTITKVTSDGDGAFDFTSSTLTPSAFTLTTTASGAAGSGSRDFDDIAPGGYDASETVPDGWELVSATCDNGDDPGSITLGVGDDVECTFTNARLRGAIEITKTRKHAADGAGDHAHGGVKFTITGGELPAGGTEVTTDANGVACLDGLVVSTLVGDYTVTETLPTGYAADGELAKDVTVSLKSSCGDGNEATVSFGNTPLTDVSISIDSQVDGGTSTVIECWVGADTSGTSDYSTTTDPMSPNNGDGTLSIDDLLPTDPDATLTCVITVDP